MKVLFAIIVISTVVFVYTLIRKNKSKTCKLPNLNNVQKFIFGDEHKAILDQFKDYKGEHLSADTLTGSTNIEPVRVHAILTDLVEHDLLTQSSTDKARGDWLYTLSDNGKKYMQEHT